MQNFLHITLGINNFEAKIQANASVFIAYLKMALFLHSSFQTQFNYAEDQVKFDQKEVERLLKHKKPFLFVSSVEVISETEIKGSLDLKKEDNPFFEGHFPGEPIMPGVLIIEALSQVAGIQTFKPFLDRGIFTLEGLQSYLYLVRVKDFAIKGKIVPDCRIDFEAEVNALPIPFFYEANGKILVDGICKAVGELVLYSRVEE